MDPMKVVLGRERYLYDIYMDYGLVCEDHAAHFQIDSSGASVAPFMAPLWSQCFQRYSVISTPTAAIKAKKLNISSVFPSLFSTLADASVQG